MSFATSLNVIVEERKWSGDDDFTKEAGLLVLPVLKRNSC